MNLSIMMQSVLMSAVRAPDGIKKDHPVKVLMRWYRRCVLISAFDGEALIDPFVEGGGSFTGPFTAYHFWYFSLLTHGTSMSGDTWKEMSYEGQWHAFGLMREVYLRHVD